MTHPRSAVFNLSGLRPAVTTKRARALALVGLAALLGLGLPSPTARAQTDTSTTAPGTATEPADSRVWLHGESLVGKVDYPADFAHFKWVNPDAPKGGIARQWAQGGFDSFNPFPVKGESAGLLGLMHDALMTSSLDEPSTQYALVAEAYSHPADYSSVSFRLREGARFQDGEPIKPEDVIFSLEELKRVNPFYDAYYRNVVKVEKTGAREVTFSFDVKGNRELPHIMGQLPVLAKHYWTDKDAKGKPRDLAESTLEPPVGSGAYRIKDFIASRSVTYERVPDYWAKDLPVTKGYYNFDQARVEYFRDKTVAFEAFKNGQLDYWLETSAKDWATRYDFPAFKSGLVVKEEIPLQTPEAMQAFVFNTRREQLKDARVRRAFNLVFDFEWANKNLFYDQYTRTDSYFENQSLASSGLPQGRELEILTELKGQIPPEVFTTAFTNPVNGTPENNRRNVREANELLKAAGWTLQDIEINDPDCGFVCRTMISLGLKSAKTDRVLRNVDGKPMEVEFLLVSPDFERIVLPFVQSLEKLGIKARARVVDTAQYKSRLDSFDFDIVVGSFGQSESPGNEQRDFWGSASADKHGSRNLIGIKDPAIDKLVDLIIYAKDRDELVAATHALDRVLLGNHFVVPQWFIAKDRIAYWDKYSRPDPLPRQSSGFLEVWWQDAAKAARVEAAQRK